jgi:hypothetical protein
MPSASTNESKAQRSLVPSVVEKRKSGFQPGHKINAKEINPTPRGRFITAQLIRQLQEDMDDPDFDPKNKTAVRKRAKVIYFFCRKLIQLALAGDTTAIKMVMDRIEGTPISTVQFKDIPEGEETPEQAAAIVAARKKLDGMTEPELHALYKTSFTEATGTAGSA